MADDTFGPVPLPAGISGTPQNPVVTNMSPSSASFVPTGDFNTDQYGLDVLKYPSELGASIQSRDYIPSYITFNIYVPSSSPYASNLSPSATNIQSASQNNSDYLNQTFGKPQSPGQLDATGAATVGGATAIQNFSSGGSVLGSATQGVVAAGAAQAISSFANDTVSLKPQLKRIGTAIQLYMPDTVMSSMNHDYSTVSATDAMGNLAWATLVGHSLADAMKNVWDYAKANAGELVSTNMGAWGDFGKGIFNTLAASAKDNAATQELAGKIAESTGAVGSGFTDLALRSSGLAVNPQVELIYRGTKNRSFTFEFRFTPRSAQEAATINKIIQTFKQFSSPGIMNGKLGRYFIVPAQFDITFYFGNTVNPYIGKISTCVLESLDVNYVGQGQWATFVDGSPVEITLMLRFLEAEIIYDALVAQGY